MWDNDNNVERIFQDEVRDKKRTASGARHNTGRRGGGTKGITGAMRMPSDLMRFNNRKAYKEYIKSGVIIVSNVYDDINNIPSIKDLKARDFKSAQSIIKTAKENHKMKDLIKHWDSSSGSLYKLFDDYKVEYPRRVKKDNYNEKDKKALPKAPTWDKKQETNTVMEQQSKLLYESKLLEEERIRKAIEEASVTTLPTLAKKEEEDETFYFKYSPKKATGLDIQNNIINFVSILEKDKKYSVKLVIREIPQEDKED